MEREVMFIGILLKTFATVSLFLRAILYKDRNFSIRGCLPEDSELLVIVSGQSSTPWPERCTWVYVPRLPASCIDNIFGSLGKLWSIGPSKPTTWQGLTSYSDIDTTNTDNPAIFPKNRYGHREREPFSVWSISKELHSVLAMGATKEDK